MSEFHISRQMKFLNYLLVEEFPKGNEHLLKDYNYEALLRPIFYMAWPHRYILPFDSILEKGQELRHLPVPTLKSYMPYRCHKSGNNSKLMIGPCSTVKNAKDAFNLKLMTFIKAVKSALKRQRKGQDSQCYNR